MENKILEIYKETIYSSKLDQNICKESFEYILPLKEKFQQKSWDCDIRTSLNITNNILNIPRLRNLKMNIIMHIENYMMEKKEFFNGYIDTSWINIYEKNFYQEYHTHVDPISKFICGVVYLTEKNSSIEFSFSHHFDSFLVEPKFSDILLFDDEVPHRVISNKEDLRVSLAFNYRKCDKWTGVKTDDPTLFI